MESQIRIIVHLHTILQRRTADGRMSYLELTLPAASTIADLMVTLDVELSLDSLLILVNRQLVEPDHLLQDGDIVNLMPAISGGTIKGTLQQSKKGRL